MQIIQLKNSVAEINEIKYCVARMLSDLFEHLCRNILRQIEVFFFGR